MLTGLYLEFEIITPNKVGELDHRSLWPTFLFRKVRFISQTSDMLKGSYLESHFIIPIKFFVPDHK